MATTNNFFNFGAKYVYTLYTSMSIYNDEPAVRISTDNRVNSKAFKQQVREINKKTGLIYRWYQNDLSRTYQPPRAIA